MIYPYHIPTRSSLSTEQSCNAVQSCNPPKLDVYIFIQIMRLLCQPRSLKSNDCTGLVGLTHSGGDLVHGAGKAIPRTGEEGRPLL